MSKFDFGSRFHDLKYFEVGFFFKFLEFLINSGEPLQRCAGNYQFNVIISYLK